MMMCTFDAISTDSCSCVYHADYGASDPCDHCATNHLIERPNEATDDIDECRCENSG